MTTVTTPTGNVIRDDDGVRLEFVRQYPDPIERVWAAVTDPDELGNWYGTWRGDPATGTVELASIEGGGEFKPIEIVECSRPRRVAVVIPTPYGAFARFDLPQRVQRQHNPGVRAPARRAIRPGVIRAGLALLPGPPWRNAAWRRDARVRRLAGLRTARRAVPNARLT